MTLRRSTRPRAERRPWTDGQQEAFRAFRLRGLFYSAWLLTGERRDAMCAAVDAELELMGCEPESVRDRRRRAEAAQAALDEEFAEVPF